MTPAHWAYGEVMLAERLDIVRGVSATEFQPNAVVTYPQAVVMALRALAYDKGNFDYPTGYVLKAKDLGLLDGLKWDLGGEMNRGEVALLLASTVFKVKHDEFNQTLSQKYFRLASSLEIRPTASQLVSGTTQLIAVGKDSYGTDLVGLQATWSVTQGSASVTQGGILSATSGKVTVKASAGGLNVSRSFQVVSSLQISPSNVTAKPGETVTLEALDPTAPGIKLDDVVWSVLSGPGTITQDGKLSVTSIGSISVQAVLGTLKSTVTVSGISGLVVEPALATVAVGSSVAFSVKTPEGQPFTGQVQWSIEGSGVITPDGKFTATPGTAPTIVAKSGSLEGSAKVQVIHRLAITPSTSVSVLQSKTQQFTAKGVTTDGTAVDVPVSWQATGGVGIIGDVGLFVGTKSGTGQVIASYVGLTQSINVSVSGEPYQVALTASRATVPANGRSQIELTATLLDAKGIVVNTDSAVSFLLSDSTKGSLSANSVNSVSGVAKATFTPSTTVGSFRITVAASELAVFAGFLDLSSYAPVPAKIALTAYPNPVASAVNSTSTITATLLDNEGYEILNTTGSTQIVNLSFTNTTAVTLSSTQISIPPNFSKSTVSFTAGNPGETLLHGASSYPVDTLTIRTLLAGPAAKLVIRPGITSTKADGSAEMLVYAEIQDANGVVRTQDHGTAVTLSGVSNDGITVIPAQGLATQSGVATFRIRSTKSGEFTYTASAGTMTSGTGVGTFTPGNATSLQLSVLPTNNVAADGISTLRLKASFVDSYGNVVPSASGTITFGKTSNNNATALPAVVGVVAVNGSAEVIVTSTAYPAVDTFKATAIGLADSNSVQITSRITGVPAKLSAQVSSGAVAVGTKVQVTVQVQDSLSQTVTSANNRLIRLVPNSATAVVTGSGVTEGGIATFTVSDTKAGVVGLSVTSDGLLSDTTKAVQFNAGTPAQIRLKLSSDEMSVDGGVSYVQLTAEAVDAYGNPVNQALPVTLTSNRTDIVTLSSTMIFTGNFVMVRSTNLPGTATISGIGTIPVSPAVLSTFIPGNPAKVRVDQSTSGAAGSQMTFRVRLLDTNGRVLTNVSTGSLLSGAGVILAGSGGNTQVVQNTNLYGLVNFQGNGVSHGSAAFTNGVATFTYTNQKAETLSITPLAYYNGVALAVETGSITTRPGNAVKLTVKASRTGLSTGVSEFATVSAVLTDAFNNVVTSSTPDMFSYAFSTTSYLSTTEALNVVTSTGRADLTIASKVHGTGGSTTVTVTSSTTGFSGSDTVITDSPPSAPILFATDNVGIDNILQPGEPAARVVVTVDARNSAQTILAYVDGVQVSLYTTSSGGSAAGNITPGQTTLVAYILRGSMGAPGVKSIRVVVQNAVAPSPMSNAQTITLQ